MLYSENQELENLETSEIISRLSSDKVNGLSEEECEKRIRIYGKNIIHSQRKSKVLKLFVAQFKNTTNYLLIVSVLISYLLNEWINGHAVLAVLMINSLIGFVMEYQADKTMNALKLLLTIHCKVIRNGQIQIINSELIVPGDIILLEGGDIIPADARIIESYNLQINESILSGESMPVEKKIHESIVKDNSDLKSQLLYKSTAVTKGTCKAIVILTGHQTEIGKIAIDIASIKPVLSPLEKKINELIRKIIQLTLIMSVIIFAVGLFKEERIYDLIETSIALAVASIPEGLPIAATLALSYGMIKLAARNVIVNKLSSVETLGGTTVICTDKTGTLTENRISLEKIVTEYYTFNTGEQLPDRPDLNWLIINSVLCNSAQTSAKDGKLNEIGDPLEAALLRFARENRRNENEIRSTYKKVNEIPFSSEARLMKTMHQYKSSFLISAKGATENILKKCNRIQKEADIFEFTSSEKEIWLKKERSLAESGLRVLAIAYKTSLTGEFTDSNDLIFLGLVALVDPPVKGVEEEIKLCKVAGIKVVMLTGDHPSTAKYVGVKIGIISNNDEVLTGDDLIKNDKEKIVNCSVFARVSPQQKLFLIEELQKKGNVVAMTGDGVNDAPALKRADVGVAMGIRGTQVAQEAASLILKDDSFHSLVYSVYQGRVMYNNIRQFIVYLVSCNLAELLIIFSLKVFNFSLTITPIQILFMNMITDVFPALALGFTSGSKEIMNQKPVPLTTSIIDNSKWKEIFLYAAAMCSFCYLSFVIAKLTPFNEVYRTPQQLTNLLFISLVFCQLIHVFNMTNGEAHFFNLRIVKNKFIWIALFICLLIVALSVIVPTMNKILYNDNLKTTELIMPVIIACLFYIFILLAKKIKSRK